MLKAAEDYAKEIFMNDYSGHDFEHTLRVSRTAGYIARQEGADPELTQLAALLHDVDDRKLSPETCANLDRAREFLHSHGIGEAQTDAVCQMIREVSFKGTDSVIPSTLEGRCVQDADRLDAMGAVGIARAFAFGGSRGRKMYNPEQPPRLNMDAASYAAKTDGCTINHFYEKLLLLEGMMTTETGRKLARHRHEFMEAFLAEFFEEWNGEIRGDQLTIP